MIRPESSGRPPGPSDVLPDELRARLGAVQRGRPESVRGLLEAVLSVGRELELPHLLRRVVEAAVVLVDAENGALGVVGADTRLDDPPTGPFLGVPIRVHGEVFGELHLTGKRGGGDFDGDDETLLATLAVAAGAAIENARLYGSARDRENWLRAGADVVADLLSGADETRALRLIVDRARHILSADLGVLALPEKDGASLRVVLATGVAADAHRGLVLPREGSLIGAALSAGKPLVSADVEYDPRTAAGVGGPARWGGLGPAVAVPMIAGEEVRGVLLLARLRSGAPFTGAETAPLPAFTARAALAMELAGRRRAAERTSVLADRDRIARDLHDLAIQRLFATGMTLQSVVRSVDRPEARERLLRAVDDLDETIKIIRSTIFGLRAHEAGRSGRGLRARVGDAVQQAVRALGFTPSLRMEGLLDTDVPPEAVEQVVAVLGEALSNVARHAHATSASVALVVRGGTLTLSVFDNGVGMGIGADRRRSGLGNLAERAHGLGGAMTVETPGEGGTRLVWTVPVVPR
ncbi:GAF domain-containing sensor histidine kinase [Streptomyces sp. NBC_01506]|uniref:GAF domain-containing sensor histidine kinase n=1 Tax=Streptomyces sp. NBC_01506 TaxID=2903887 RepID=UPI0038633D71